VRKPPLRLATWVADGMPGFYRRTYPRAVSKLEGLYFQRCFEATLRHSDVIFTISDFTSNEVSRLARELNIRPPPSRLLRRIPSSVAVP